MIKYWKIVIVSAPLVAILSFGCYFTFFLPRLQAAQALADHQEACQKQQSVVLTAYKDSLIKIGMSWMADHDLILTSVHYNPSLEKCFVEVHDSTSYRNRAMNTIVIYTGLAILDTKMT